MDKLTRFLTKKSRNVQAAGLTIQNTQLHHQQQTEDEIQHQRTEDEQQKNQQIEDKQQPQQTEDKQQHQRTEDKQQHQHGEAANAFIEENIHHHFSSQVTHHHSPHTSPHHFSPHLLPQHPSTPPFTNLLESPGNKKRKLFSRLNQRDNNNNNNFNNNNNDNNFNNNNNNFNEKNNNYNDNNNNFNDNNNNNFNDNSKNNNFNKKDNNFNNDKTNKSNKSIHHGGIQDHYHHSLEVRPLNMTHSSQTEEETPFFHNSLLSIHPSTHPSTHTCTHIAHKQILHPHNKLILSNDNNDDDGEEDEDGGDGDGNDPAPGENIRVTKSINKETHEQHEDQCTKSDIDNNINKDEHNSKPPHSHIADNSTKSNHNHLFNFHNNNSNHNTNNNKNTDLGSFNNTSINNTTQVSKINRSQSGNKCFGVHGESCHGNSSSSKTGCRCSKRYSYYTSWGSYSNSCVNHNCSNNSCGNHGNCHVNHSNSCNISSYAAQSCHRTSQGGHCIGADDYSCDKNNNNNNIDAHSSLVNSGGKGLVLGRKSPMVTSSTEHLYRSVIGQIFLMCDSEMKRCVLLQSINSMDTIFKIVCEAFPRKISMWQLSSSTPFYQLYLLDSQLSLFYLLEDYRDVKNLSVIKIFPAQESHPQQDINDQQIQQPQITYQRQQQELDDFNQQQQQQHTTPTESPKLTSNSPKGHKTNTLKQNKKQKQQYQLNNNNNSSARVANMGCFGQMTSYRTIFSKKLHKSPLKSLTSHTKYDLKHQKFDPEVEGSIPSKKQKSLHKLSLKPQSPNSRSSKFTSSSSSSSSFDRCNNYYSLERNRNSRCKHPHTTTILKPQRSLSANSSPSVSINNNLNKNNKTCNKCNKNYDVYNNNNNEIKNNKLESNDASTHTMKKTKYCCRKHCSCYNTQHNYSHNTPQHHNRRSCSYHYHHPPQDHYHYPLHDHYHHQTSSSESLPLDLVNTNYNICNNNISINNENVESNNNISSINSNSNNIDNNKNKNNNANDQNNKNSKSEAEERVKELEKQLACLTEWVQTTIQTDQKIQHFQDNFMQHKHIKTDNTEDDVDDVDNNTLKNENKEKKTDTKRKSDIDTLTKKGDKKSSRDTKAETDTQKKPDRETSKERFGMVVGELRHQCEELRVAHQVQMNELISMVSTVRRAIKKTTDSNNAYEELPVSWGTPPSVRIRPLSSHSTLYQAANSYHNNSSLLKNPKNSLHSNSHGNHYSIYAYNSIQEGTHCGDSCYCGSSHHYGGIGEEYNHHHQQGHQTAQQHKAQINPNDYYLCGTQQQNNNNNNINCNNNNNNHNVRRNKSCNRDLSPEDSPDVVKSNRGSEDIKSHRNIATYSKIKKQKNEENKDKDRNNKKNDKKINGTEESKADKIWVPM